MKRYLAILLVLCIFLCGCSQAASNKAMDSVGTTILTVENNQPDVLQTTASPGETTLIPDTTDSPVELVHYRNPLNGEPVDSVWTTRPFAVTINNIEYAQPLCSISEADFLFEILAEGGITRCMAVYSDVSEVLHIGSLRSCRPYFADLANGLGAIYVHHGGTDDGYAMISSLDLDDIDADSAAYFRDQERLDLGYDYEHTSFTHGKFLINAANDLGYAITSADAASYGFQFDDNGSTADGTDASQITVAFGGYGKTTKLTYNAASGAYTAFQYNADVIDGNTGEVVNFRNVLVIKTETSSYAYGSKTVLDITLTGEGEGYFACDGKIVPITWSRADQHSPFVFTHEDGSVITFGVGSTYVAIVPISSAVEVQ